MKFTTETIIKDFINDDLMPEIQDFERFWTQEGHDLKNNEKMNKIKQLLIELSE